MVNSPKPLPKNKNKNKANPALCSSLIHSFNHSVNINFVQTKYQTYANRGYRDGWEKETIQGYASYQFLSFFRSRSSFIASWIKHSLWRWHDAQFCQERALQRHCRKKGLFVPKLLQGFWFLPRAVASRLLGWWPAALIPISSRNSPWMGFLWITGTLRWLHLQPERVFPAGWSLLTLQLLPACLAQSQRERPHRMNCSHTFLNTIWIPAWGRGPPSQHAPSFIVFLSLRWFCRVHFTPFQIISEGGNNYFRSGSQGGPFCRPKRALATSGHIFSCHSWRKRECY